MSGSVSFDRAAEIYDRTRVTDPDALRETIDVLEGELDRGGDGPMLEVGVGTGALALPLAARGVPVVGVDLAPAMLALLRAKPGGDRVAVAVADATRLPFDDGAFAGAYARWVLHLIPAWRDVVDELCRVVRPGGVVLIEPGGYRRDRLEIWRMIDRELGRAVRHVGLDVHERGFADLDAAFAVRGATARDLPPIDVRASETLAGFLEQARAKAFSWTWRVGDRDLARGLDAVEARARERYGDDLASVASEIEMLWRAYDLPPG
ncbi:MAG TPA: class I SAM-dependent methyltransferase [Actinomycetota bacterium]